ncbi:SigE family RNA polymerase sigma factor [Phycicoccus sonneratiae]|uniref:SigE family RNA polymerase sigma factor n=1 Tax=Phycicoccus sonneratiae TaxID=2807628 RepID=A0ABS2CMG0_9MICO|nr:SigE family RNA polymerase sigma factor [Phycicoccus sonneraticus]MBM6401052.1 SigE family RNA polymerase sigma factor [Phycicoccus sonneraticus]
MGSEGKARRDADFARFVAASTPSLLRTARLLTGSRDAAQELVQATLVKTYLAWHRVRDEDALPYARRILVNQRTDRWRRTRGEVVVAEPPDRVHDDGTGSDDRDQIVRLLATLPERQRYVVVLRYYHDLSEQAVAELLGISVGTVKSAASRGLATLRAAHPSPDPSEESLR